MKIQPNAAEGVGGGGGGGGLPLMAYTRRLSPKGVCFFRLQLYERVGILLVKVYKLGDL